MTLCFYRSWDGLTICWYHLLDRLSIHTLKKMCFTPPMWTELGLSSHHATVPAGTHDHRSLQCWKTPRRAINWNVKNPECVTEPLLSAICSYRHQSVGLTLQIQTHICCIDRQTCTCCCPPEPEVAVDLAWALTCRFPQVLWCSASFTEAAIIHQFSLSRRELKDRRLSVEFSSWNAASHVIPKPPADIFFFCLFFLPSANNDRFVFAALFVVGVKRVINPLPSSSPPLWQW